MGTQKSIISSCDYYQIYPGWLEVVAVTQDTLLEDLDSITFSL